MQTMQSLIGQTLGQHKIIEKIGEGGMATVFKAHQSGLNREVALKVLPPHIAEKEGFAERFIREAEAIGNLHHPNILPVYDSGQKHGFSYIAMRYIPQARTLADMMHDHPLSEAQILKFAQQIAAALDHAHAAGIVHRDVKPSNILMDKEWVYLSDFGLAKAVEKPSELTGTGIGIGTPAYMSPEQAKGEPLDHRTDIYALGIILFEMLTGKVPHQAETPIATVMKRVSDPPPSARSLKPDISVAVEAVLLKALAHDPAHRFNQAGSLAQALEEAIVGTGQPVGPPPTQTQATPASAPLQAPASTSRTVDIVLITLLGVVALCGISGAFLSFIPDTNTGELNLALLPMCLAPAFAAITSGLMIGFRQRSVPASALLAVGIIAWFVGVNFIGGGVFALINPESSQDFIGDLGFSLALCFTPGGVLSLLGLGLYAFDYRRANRQAMEQSGQQVDIQQQTPVQQKPAVVDSHHAEKIKKAVAYRQQITNLIKQQSDVFAGQLQPITTRLENWEAHLKELTQRLEDFENDPLVQRDLVEVPAAIKRLSKQLERETNPSVQTEIAETLDKQRKHQEQLDSLVMVMRRTELDIDETLATIGSIYSQLQLFSAKGADKARAKNLSTDIAEQAEHLNDLLEAMEEVYDETAGM